jgi:hypothetical protein
VQVRARGGLARLSLNNQLLVALGCPDATFVAGFKAWLKVLGLTARIQRFGGYATDEVGLAPEPFEPATTGRDLRDRSGPRACPHWAREEVERSRRETVVLSDR